MLIDELLASEHIENVLNPEHIKRQLAKAQKFELAPDFAASAEQLAENYNTIAHAVPYCRLPYPLTWIEVAQEHRPRFREAPIHLEGIQKIPHRVGFLLSSTDDKLSTFTAHQFWKLKIHPIPHGSHLAMNFDPQAMLDAEPMPAEDPSERRHFKIGKAPEWYAASAEVRGQLSSMVRPIAPEYRTGIELLTTDRHVAEIMLEVGAADWSGESIYLLAVLALLNTINATKLTLVDSTKLNKIRAKHKQPLLSNYHTITIHPRIKRYVVDAGSPRNHHAELRAHLVRGHWKIRKTGIYFWKPHVRGDKNKGEVTKNYTVD